MKRKHKTQPSHQSTSASLSLVKEMLYRRLKEGGFIAIAAFSLFLILALFTYQSSDPGWTHTGIHREIFNSAGYVGACLADFLFYLFGYMGYLIPLLILYLGWLFFLKP